MSTAAAIAVAAGLTEEFLDDLREQIEQQPKPEAINYQHLADTLAARLQPQLEVLAERLASAESTIAASNAQLALVTRQQASIRRKLR